MKNNSIKNYAEVALRSEVLTPDFDHSGRRILKSKECVKFEHELLDSVSDHSESIINNAVNKALSIASLTNEDINEDFLKQLIGLNFIKAQAQGDIYNKNFVTRVEIFKNGMSLSKVDVTKRFNEHNVFSPHFNSKNSIELVNRTRGSLNEYDVIFSTLTVVSRQDFKKGARREEVNTWMQDYEK